MTTAPTPNLFSNNNFFKQQGQQNNNMNNILVGIRIIFSNLLT